MATNTIQDSATTVQITAGGTYTSGTPVRIGTFFGVPQSSAVSGDKVTMQIRGECKLVKVGGAASFAVGDKVYWDGTTCTAVATDHWIGVASRAATAGATELYVELNGAVIAPVDADAIAGAASGTYAGHLVRTSGTAVTYKKANFAGTAAPSATDDSATDYAIGSFWLDTTNDRAYVCLDATATAAVWREISHAKDNLAGTTAPAVTDDSAAGYGIGSRWLDTTNDRAYVCLDATAAAAVWLPAGLPVKASASQIDSGQSAKTIAVGAAFNGFPVLVTIKSTAAGAVVGAGVAPIFKAEISGGNLVVTCIDALTGNAANVSQNLPFHYAIVGTI